MGSRMIACQGSRPMGRERRRPPQFDGNRMVEEGGFYDQVVNGTVKVGFIVLIGLIVIEGQVGVRVMDYQGVDHNFRGNAQREQSQHDTC
jgi:hypothetical protein